MSELISNLKKSFKAKDNQTFLCPIYHPITAAPNKKKMMP